MSTVINETSDMTQSYKYTKLHNTIAELINQTTFEFYKARYSFGV